MLCHLLNILDEVTGIDIVAVPAKLRSTDIIFLLHPGRGGPRRGHYLDVRIYLQNLLHDRHDITQVIRQREMFEGEVRLALRHVIIGEHGTVHVGSSDRQADVTDSQGIPGEKFIQDVFSGLRCHLHKKFGTSTGKGEAKAFHTLIGLP